MPCPPSLRALCALVLTLAAVPALAPSSPGDFTPLLPARQLGEAESLARERVARKPRDGVAWWCPTQVEGNDAKKPDALLPQVEKCVAELPQSARCHHAAGTLYAALATSAGLSGGLKYAGRIKDSFLRAIELDPRHFEMRRDLIQFYLQAPGVAGGSVRRAVAQAEACAAIDPVRGRLLRADVHAYESEWGRRRARSPVCRRRATPDWRNSCCQRGWRWTPRSARTTAWAWPASRRASAARPRRPSSSSRPTGPRRRAQPS